MPDAEPESSTPRDPANLAARLAARRFDSSCLAPSALADLLRIGDLVCAINWITEGKNKKVRGNPVENSGFFGD